MIREPLAAILTSDLVAQVRGRAVAKNKFQDYLTKGCGWVPANLALNPFGDIVEPNEFGQVGDLQLRPDPNSVSRLTTAQGDELKVVLADMKNVDGTPWDCCPRTFLRDAIADFRTETGMTLLASFEHEFTLLDGEDAVSKPFSLRNLIDREPLGSSVMAALDDAGLEPEMWLPEYGEKQWEVTIAPSSPLAAADRAIFLREIVRNVATQLGHDASFSPVTSQGANGSGVHIHMSLLNDDGAPVMWNPTRKGGLSKVGGSFAAGILQHAPALVALAASGVVSYERLSPGNWSVGGVFLGENNREALLRICPLFERPNANPARQYNLEFRAADATSNPWLVLGALIRAGLEGIRQDLPTPRIDSEDAPQDESGDQDLPSLPTSLEDALDRLDQDDVVKSWFSPRLYSTFVTVKRNEMEHVSGLTEDQMYAEYASAY